MTKAKKKSKPSYYTIGVRFLQGNVSPVYTYRVKIHKTVTLGQELIAHTPRDTSVCVVVRIDRVRQDTNPMITYKYIEHRVAPL